MRWMTRIALVALLAGAAGCMRFAPAAVPAPGPNGWRSIGHARVTTTDSRHYLLRDVSVTADSLIGFEEARNLDRAGLRRIAVHRDEIRRLERMRVAPVRTGLLTIVLGYVALIAISLHGADS